MLKRKHSRAKPCIFVGIQNDAWSGLVKSVLNNADFAVLCFEIAVQYLFGVKFKVFKVRHFMKMI